MTLSLLIWVCMTTMGANKRGTDRDDYESIKWKKSIWITWSITKSTGTPKQSTACWFKHSVQWLVKPVSWKLLFPDQSQTKNNMLWVSNFNITALIQIVCQTLRQKAPFFKWVSEKVQKETNFLRFTHVLNHDW